MIRPCAIALVFLAVAIPRVFAEPIYLVVAASGTDPVSIARQARKLATIAPDGLVVNVWDCGEPRQVFAYAATVSASRDRAQQYLRRIKPSVSDAYIKPCTVRPRSLLAFRIPAVDPSIAEVPVEAVNWSDADRVSALLPLVPGASLAVIRRFENIPEDPLEGRRQRLLLIRSSGDRVVLSENCLDVGHASMVHGVIAFACAEEQAADHLLHSVLVVGQDGRALREIEHCRDPAWIRDRELTCQAERIGIDGRIRLTRQRIDLAQ